jgi:CheY-like chemotaxis protein/HPt (histidine-containing phosphotransfer) domain-containing protein
MLERAGHEAVVARNGQESLLAVEKETFDLVLMDVQMPVLDGLQATSAIRERERTSGGHLPIVAVTAHAGKADRERSLAAGMDAHVTKPLQARDLQAAIEAVLGGRPQPPAAPEPTRRLVVDEAVLLERVGHDRAALAALVRTFLADYPRQLARVRRALGARDARGLRDAAHALKGAVANFAARAATEAAQQLQEIGAKGDITGAPGATSHLEHELERVKKALLALAPRAQRGGLRGERGASKAGSGATRSSGVAGAHARRGTVRAKGTRPRRGRPGKGGR